MTDKISKPKKLRKLDNTNSKSLPNEVIQILSLKEFSDDIDFFMKKYDRVFRGLIEK